jgi:hypothetical protein
MKKRKIFIWGLIVIMLFSEKVFAANFLDVDSSSIAGYYFSEELSLVFMDNGIAYNLNPEYMENGVPSERYTVSSDGNHYLIKIQDDFICLSKQNEKEKTDNGGVYYALYRDYEGSTNEMSYQEGKQVLFGDCIFDNDYEVIVREPLANFFSIQDNHLGTIESRGYKSPEDAAKAYLEAFMNNDIDQMLSTFAVETYVKNFDLEKYVDRVKWYTLNVGIIPTISEYSDKLNIETRRSDIITRIKHQYMVFTGAKVGTGDLIGAVPFNSQMTSSEFIQDIFTDNDEGFLSNIEFDGIFIAPQLLSEVYTTENNLKNLQKQAETFGADKIESVAAFLTIDAIPYLLCMDTVCYDNIWYVLNLCGNIGALIGSDSYKTGLIKLSNVEVENIYEKDVYEKYIAPKIEMQKDTAETEAATEKATEAEIETEEAVID